MFTLATLVAFALKAFEFVKKYRRFFFIGLGAVILLIIVLRLTSCESKPDTHIVVPHEAIKELQKQREAELKKVFDDADDRRKAIDAKIVRPTPSPKKNVTAADLKEVTK